jgi:hypothetical protein
MFGTGQKDVHLDGHAYVRYLLCLDVDIAAAQIAPITIASLHLTAVVLPGKHDGEP